MNTFSPSRISIMSGLDVDIDLEYRTRLDKRPDLGLPCVASSRAGYHIAKCRMVYGPLKRVASGFVADGGSIRAI